MTLLTRVPAFELFALVLVLLVLFSSSNCARKRNTSACRGGEDARAASCCTCEGDGGVCVRLTRGGGGDADCSGEPDPSRSRSRTRRTENGSAGDVFGCCCGGVWSASKTGSCMPDSSDRWSSNCDGMRGLWSETAEAGIAGARCIATLDRVSSAVDHVRR